MFVVWARQSRVLIEAKELLGSTSLLNFMPIAGRRPDSLNVVDQRQEDTEGEHDKPSRPKSFQCDNKAQHGLVSEWHFSFVDLPLAR